MHQQDVVLAVLPEDNDGVGHRGERAAFHLSTERHDDAVDQRERNEQRSIHAGPHQTEVWRWYLVDRDSPPEVKDFLRQYYIRYSGPAGLTEQDDMENWNYAHAASRGTIARRHPYTYEQGMGFEVENYEWDGLQLPGSVMDITEAKSSEHNLRNLYRRWAEFMEAESWDELATWRTPAR